MNLCFFCITLLQHWPMLKKQRKKSMINEAKPKMSSFLFHIFFFHVKSCHLLYTSHNATWLEHWQLILKFWHFTASIAYYTYNVWPQVAVIFEVSVSHYPATWWCFPSSDKKDTKSHWCSARSSSSRSACLWFTLSLSHTRRQAALLKAAEKKAGRLCPVTVEWSWR